MFGGRYFGRRFFGRRYWGKVGAPLVLTGVQRRAVAARIRSATVGQIRARSLPDRVRMQAAVDGGIMLAYDAKDPEDTDDFSISWANVLASGETIVGATASVQAGALSVSGSVSVAGAETTARLTSGTEGVTGRVRVRATTSTGRQLNQTMLIPIAEQ